MYISHPQFEYRLKQFYLSEDLLRSLHLICLSRSYLRSSPTTPILRNKGPYLLWAQHQSWSQSPSKHPTNSDTSEDLTTPNIRTTPKSRSSTNLTVLLRAYQRAAILSCSQLLTKCSHLCKLTQSLSGWSNVVKMDDWLLHWDELNNQFLSSLCN